MQKNNSKILSRSGHHSETFAAFGLFVGQKSPNWQFLGMKKFSVVVLCHSVLQQCRNTEKSTNITCIHRIFWWMWKKLDGRTGSWLDCRKIMQQQRALCYLITDSFTFFLQLNASGRTLDVAQGMMKPHVNKDLMTVFLERAVSINLIFIFA